MPRSKTKTTRYSYNCPKYGQTVTITTEWLMHLNQRGDVDAQAPTKRDCDGRDHCGVGIPISPGAISYDWTQCVHPDFKR